MLRVVVWAAVLSGIPRAFFETKLARGAREGRWHRVRVDRYLVHMAVRYAADQGAFVAGRVFPV